MTDQPVLANSPILQRPQTAVWCLGAIAGVALWAAIGANLPDRIKLLGLFPLIWAGLTGIGLRWFADEMHISVRIWAVLLVGTLIAAGEAGMVLGGWTLYCAELQKQFEKTPQMSMGDLMDSKRANQSKAGDDSQSEAAKMRQQMEQELDARILERRAVQGQLATYLYRRIQRLGDVSSPWPEVFWGCEIVFGSLIGIWCFKHGHLGRA
jgi:hypothetical protein